MVPFDPAIAAGLGLLAGIHHALSGPDHLAGVAPLASAPGARPWRVGLLWGTGHALGAASAAALALALRSRAPELAQGLSARAETLVGMLLCAIGGIGLSAALRPRVHAHPRSSGKPALLLGWAHGAAGLSHLFAVLPALALPGLLAPAAYLAGYGAGSLAAITACALLFGAFAPAAGHPARRWFLGLSSGASLSVGLVWIVHPL